MTSKEEAQQQSSKEKTYETPEPTTGAAGTAYRARWLFM
jgi:hypothetical protein